MSLGTSFLVLEKITKPTKPPKEKLINCLLVKFKATLVFTFDKSFGTGTNAI